MLPPCPFTLEEIVMHYPKNAKKVLRLIGVRIATVLSVLLFVALVISFFGINEKFHIDSASVGNTTYFSGFAIIGFSFLIVAILTCTSLDRIYEKYDEKAEFQILLTQLIAQIAYADMIDDKAKRIFIEQHVKDLRFQVTSPSEQQSHLQLLANKAKEIIDEILIDELKILELEHSKSVRDAKGVPSSQLANTLSGKCFRIEKLRSALKARTPDNTAPGGITTDS